MKEKIVDLFTAQAETPLAIANQCLVSGKFTPATKPVGKGEVVLGELTPFEKALYTASKRIVDINNKLVNKVGKNKNPLRLLVVQSIQNKAEHEAIRSLFWSSLRKRLGSSAYESDGLGIRSGYKVVRLPNEPYDAVVSLLEAMALDYYAHCDKECDLPHKKEG